MLHLVIHFICEVLKITFPMSNATKKYTVIKQQRGPKLKLIFSVTKLSSDTNDIETESITCHENLALVKMSFKSSSSGLQINMKIKRDEQANHLLPVKIICKEKEGEFYCSDEWLDIPITSKSADSYIVHENQPTYAGGFRAYAVLTFVFEVNIKVTSIPTTATTPVASLVTNQLFEDEEFPDFQLQGTDGNVPVHKSILLIHSDMVKTMLRGGKWEESKNSCMKINGANVETLNHLKAYMYLGILPEEGLESLLLIASCYLMEQLRTDCIAKVVNTVKPGDIECLVKFACENNMPDLVIAVTTNLR